MAQHATREYAKFQQYGTQAKSMLRAMRTHLRHHVERPDFDVDGLFDELSELIKDLQYRKKHKITTEPIRRAHELEVKVPTPQIIFVDSIAKVQDVIRSIEIARVGARDHPILYLDCEGDNMGRRGTLDLVNIFVPRENVVFVINVATLKEQAFSATMDNEALNLKAVLEDESMSKAIFDCRTDSDALFSHFGIKLAGVVDIQLLDNVTQWKKKKVDKLQALSCCFHRLNLKASQLQALETIQFWGKEAMRETAEDVGRRMSIYVPGFETREPTAEDRAQDEIKGRVAIGLAKPAFDEKPLPPFLLQYVTADLILLPALYHHLTAHPFWSNEWAARERKATISRLAFPRSPDFDSRKIKMNLPPDGRADIERTSRAV
ncbi:hypothetical protein CLAFUW4_01299 [Fulvia fulva]|uniref:3'-5' exonuclease domain-containing protein n=1 Tax=Passalora fulva TaxID=5499 RepID=A0A9Q8P4S7_PASFU|nr:uncharacterized protein CLAFUR5_01304 [Fulvia fulva]KAK4636031.1 hypothetical protein CLAFUR4_01300 [Fulvia fulva]KAK4638092.1 hypothetical protein CLAFUR0_01301 [Fulvia fulva]UJO13037.1 hypothetical protein CLAFUR5_01304 [Fulvia fulva]WPV08198.1 hypothetical protein CLAFUW4_01299 [Fulvia fulva]WPV25314.1 hypothetical protein CLAFUW7_01304 [Fulvia fulva]